MNKACLNCGTLRLMVMPFIIKLLNIDFPVNQTKLSYSFMSETDLLMLASAKTCALTCAVSNFTDMLAVYGKDRLIRIFNLRTGRLIRTFDDSLASY